MIGSLRAGAACLGVGLLLLVHAMPARAQETAPVPTVTYPTSVQISSPLSSAPPASAAPTTGQRPLEIPVHGLAHQGQPVPGSEHASDRAAQTNAAHVLDALPKANFGGISSDGYIPPDPNIAVSANNIVEMVNSEIAVYDKAGNLEPGYPKTLSNLWTSLGSACGNSGDPVVQYDRLATNSDGTTGRWFISQLQSLNSPYGECIAVSTGSDPGGSYYLYFYNFGSNLNDYPKFGVWPTATNAAYLGTYNLFGNGSNFVGADLCAYDRTAMLAGANSPAQVCFTLPANADGGFLPADLDGAMPPGASEAGYFLAYNASTNSSLTLYKMTLDFSNTANSTLSASTEIPVAAFAPACGGGACIVQPSTNRKLDSLGDRLMYRLAYRNFGDHENMVVNHSVTSPSGTAAPRWYLLRMDATTQGQFKVDQQGTYAPDSAYRWMGSIAMDQSGDILLGYSRSSSTSYPSIYVAGRVPTDPAGTLSQEISLKAGGGSQTGYYRWGDYTSMRIDPADDCTFWYVNEYLPQTSFGNWYTYIGSHKITGCGGGGGGASPDFGLSLTPTSLTVNAGSNSTVSLTVTSMNDFNSSVSFNSTCSGLISCSATSVTPPKNSSASSALTVAVAQGADSGTITEMVTGTSGPPGSTTSHSASFTLTVPASDFSISAGILGSISRGSSGSVTITLTDNGLSNSSTALSVSGLPRQTSATFSPSTVKVNTLNPVSSTLKITVGRNATRGTYPLTVTGTNSGYTKTTQVSLTIR